MLGWLKPKLADAAGVSVTAVKRAESDSMGSRASTLDAIVSALVAAGVEFADGGWVRLRPQEEQEE